MLNPPFPARRPLKFVWLVLILTLAAPLLTYSSTGFSDPDDTQNQGIDEGQVGGIPIVAD